MTTSRLAGIAWLLSAAVAFGANHVSARLAFDHGVSVTTAVAFRSAVTVLLILGLLRFTGIPARAPRHRIGQATIIGLLVALQSLCLYGAVARLPVALALLAFNSFPIALALITWALGGQRPSLRTSLAMTLALCGLALALDVQGAIGRAGQAWLDPLGLILAFSAAICMGMLLFLTSHWLADMDGRVRTLIFMVVVGVIAALGALVLGGFRWPHDPTGWLGLTLLSLLYCFGITIFFVVLPRLGAVDNAAVMNFEPVAALGLGWLVLDQRLAAPQMAGMGLVIVAIGFIATRRSR